MYGNRVFCAGALTILSLLLVVTTGWAADESDLAGRAVAWQEAFNSDDLEAVAELYTEDACRMPPNAESLQGREAIMADLRARKEAGVAEIDLAVTEAESVGDLAYGAGTYGLMGADGSHIDHGRWLNVSKRVNGEWKIYCDIWNSSMALPTP